jgi:hypothetical protein
MYGFRRSLVRKLALLFLLSSLLLPGLKFFKNSQSCVAPNLFGARATSAITSSISSLGCLQSPRLLGDLGRCLVRELALLFLLSSFLFPSLLFL